MTVKNDAVFLIEDQRFVDCNREAQEMFGATRAQLLHKAPYQLSPRVQPDGAKSRQKAMEKIELAAAGSSQLFEWKHRRMDGTLFDAEVSLNRVEVGGKPVVLAVVRDITERKREDAERLEVEQMFRAIVENSHAGIFTIDENFKITYANGMTSVLLARPNDEIIGHDFREMLDEESRQLVAERYIRRQMGEDVPSRYEFNILRKDGTKRRVEISSTIFRSVSGKLRTVGQVLDITDRKKAEKELLKAHEELESRVAQRTSQLSETNRLLENEITRRTLVEQSLRQSELKFRHLVQNASTIILEMDTEGRITFFNSFAEEFFGYKEAEILGKNVLDTIVPPEDSAGRDLRAMINNIIAYPDKYQHNENENVKRDGERVWIVWTNRPLFDEDGKLREILCMGIDRTEQKRSEQMAARREREEAAAMERNRLARDLHDAVSQALFSASLISEVLPRLWQRDEKEGFRRLEEVRQLTRGALAEMRTLLLELRPDSLVEADIDFLLNQLAESISSRSRVPVNVAIAGRCAIAVEVKVALYRIAQEALNNVVKHAGAGHVDVKLSCRNGRVILSVADDGEGFEVKKLPPNTLGMSIMRERARETGAAISVRSRPGRGTTVRVVWSSQSEEAKNG
jgi:PAS domain S-box-containing protein